MQMNYSKVKSPSKVSFFVFHLRWVDYWERALDTGILIQRLLGSSKYALQKSNQQYQFIREKRDLHFVFTPIMWFKMKVNEKDLTVPKPNVRHWFSQQYSMLEILQCSMAYSQEPLQCTTKREEVECNNNITIIFYGEVH
jgi:hypothetical protein